MRREDRAKQFAPFDALKGLHEALKIKEYEHDRMAKGDVSEEKIMEISKILQEIDKHTLIEVKYFYDGYEKSISGSMWRKRQPQRIVLSGERKERTLLLLPSLSTMG